MFLLQPAVMSYPQGGAKGTAAVTGDKAEEKAGLGKDNTTHHGACWQGSEGRAGPLPSTQHPHQSSATWLEETGRTLGHHHCEHISGQRSLEESVFRSTMRRQRVDISKGHPRPTVLAS